MTATRTSPQGLLYSGLRDLMGAFVTEDHANAAAAPGIVPLGRRAVRRTAVALRTAPVPPWLATVVVAWLATRLVILLTAEAAIYLGTRLHFHHLEPHRHSTDSVTAFLSSWDGAWYVRIAHFGYPAHLDPHHFSGLAFFPLLPLLLHAVVASGLPASTTIGLMLTNVVALFALIAVAALTESVMGSELAGRTALYVAISPLGFVLGMLYTEALLLVCAFGAVALVLRNRPWLALPLALATGLCRPTGVLIMIPLAYLSHQADDQRLARIAVLLAPAFGLGAFVAYVWVHTGDPLAFAHAETAWGRGSASPDELSQSLMQINASLIRGVIENHHRLWLARDAIGGLVTVGLLVYGWCRGIRWPWLLFGAATILLPLLSGSMMSLARFGLFCLPAFWALALLGRRPNANQAYLIVAPALFAVGELLLLARWP